MSTILIETECRACRHLVHIGAYGYCSNCGAGPASPSRERVDLVYGRPSKIPLDQAGRQAVWPSTRPARQVISANAVLHAPIPDAPRKRRRGRIVTAEQIVAAVREWVEYHAETPSRAVIAAELGCHVTTLKRAAKDAGLEGWPPRPPSTGA